MSMTPNRPKRSRSRQRKYRYELLDNATGEVLLSFTSRAQGLSESCQYLRDHMHENPDVSLVFMDVHTSEVHFSAATEDLLELCSDEGVEAEEDLGYDEA